ncbi:MAG: homoserine dehydrogenase [Ruminococcaceae bacterium]|nr:homoserine dehydrogenase [Oscillospiraceae bacterium]
MMKIGVIGFGVVGSGVYEVIRKNRESIARKAGQEVDIKYILDIRDFSDHPEKELFVKDFDTMVNDAEVGIIVEVMGGLDPAYEYTKRALCAGKHVVTSNKELVATYGDELLALANKNGVSYLFEASVGGGIPIIRPLNQCLAANEISAIVGILNGTTNYILTQMFKNGKDFDVALKDAQEKGYAERNPAADVEGYDACRKICILSSLAFGKHVDYREVYTEGITALTLRDIAYAEEMGCVVKLLGYSKLLDDGRIDIKVAPMMIPNEQPLATVSDVYNGIQVRGNAIGDAMFYGPGAGKLPTASAVVADVIDIAKAPERAGRVMWVRTDEKLVLPADEACASYFVRVETADKNAVSVSAKAEFDGATIIDKFDNELGILTGCMSEGELKGKLSNLPGKVIGFLRVLPQA